MKTRHFYAAVLCLSAVVALTARPTSAQLTPHYGDRISSGTTPEQQARLEQLTQMCRMGAVALHAGDYVQAEADARQALALGDWSGRGMELVAGALAAQGKDREALQEYDQIASRGGNYPRNLLPYALLLLKSGQWAQAVAAYDKALPLLAEGDVMRANSNFSSSAPNPVALASAVHIARGLTYNASSDFARQNQDDLALTEYQKALQLAPDSDLANYYYGYGLQRLGRTEQSNAVFQKTLKMTNGSVKIAAQQALKKNKKPV